MNQKKWIKLYNEGGLKELLNMTDSIMRDKCMCDKCKIEEHFCKVFFADFNRSLRMNLGKYTAEKIKGDFDGS